MLVTYLESDGVEETGGNVDCRATTEGRAPNEREAPRREATLTEQDSKRLEALHELRSMCYGGTQGLRNDASSLRSTPSPPPIPFKTH